MSSKRGQSGVPRRKSLALLGAAVAAAGITGVVGGAGALALRAGDGPSRSGWRDVTDSRWGGPDILGDWTDAIRRALAEAPTGVAVTLYFPPGTFRINGGIKWGTQGVLRIVGAGIGQVGDTYGTRLVRESGSSPLIDAQGAPLGVANPYDPPQRTRIELYDLELHGNGTPGYLLHVFRGQQMILERVRVSHAAGTGIRLTQMFNSMIDKLFVGYCGDGLDHPALLLDGTDEGAPAGSNTVHLSNCEFETNNGIDLVVEGSTAQSPSVAVLVSSTKIERLDGNFPLVRLRDVKGVGLSGVYFYLGNGSTPLIKQESTAGGWNRVSDATLAHAGPATSLIDVMGGRLQLSNITFEETHALSHIDVHADVPIDGLQSVNLATTRGSLRLNDARNR